ncbi:MAG: hypothetical protein QME96_17840, partial [Myxococcota bacterium]|nr:hypothetical protein [Myxococcota bacterium]
VSVEALVAALRRHADDPAYPAPMGPRGAHRVLAAVIDILARKRLLTEQELSEALREQSAISNQQSASGGTTPRY